MPAARIRVTVVAKSNRKYLLLRCRDNLTGIETVKSSETTNRRQAERAAALWEEDLRKQRETIPDEISWVDFVKRYRSESLEGLKPTTLAKAMGVLNVFRERCRPSRLSDVTSRSISQFQAARRRDGLAETSISSELGHLKAALRWAKDLTIISEAPHFVRVRRAKTGGKPRPMKGRPITASEFERMIAATASIVNDERAAAWERYLRGLWVSGLRLDESLEIWWDRDDKLSVDLSQEFPMLRVAADSEKANRDRYLPIAPEFADFLLQTQPEERTGRVFSPPVYRPTAIRIMKQHASKIISKIGEKANVIVETKGPKYASAHDLRRSFGTRWARLVTPQVLMQLMRHESIQTTMRYYVDLDAQETAKTLWEVSKRGVGDKAGDSKAKSKKLPAKKPAKP